MLHQRADKQLASLKEDIELIVSCYDTGHFASLALDDWCEAMKEIVEHEIDLAKYQLSLVNYRDVVFLRSVVEEVLRERLG